MEEVKSNGSAELPKGEEKGPAPGGAPTDAPDKGGAAEQGTEFTEFQDPKAEARFKRIYGHVKRNERVIGQMAGDNKILFDANQKLLERFAALEKNITEKGSADSLAWLQTERKNSIEAGDLARVADLSDKIAEIKLRTVEARLTARKEAPPVQMGTRQEQDFLGSDLREAFTDWAAEKDKTTGNFTRPWAQKGHPEFNSAVEMSAAVLNNPRFRDKDADAVLREVDRLMGNSKPAAATVLSGKNEDGGKVKPTKLSAEQLAVAKKMGVAPEKYAAQMERYKRA